MNNTLTSPGYAGIGTLEFKKPNISKIVYAAGLMSFAIPAISLLSEFLMHGQAGVNIENARSQSDYVLMLLQCVLGIAAMNAPWLVKKCFKFELPAALQISFFAFLFCAIYLGEVKDFYNIVPHWDTMLHTFSGVMIGLLGYMIITAFIEKQKGKMSLPPIFIAVFIFCFAVCVGAVWEIYEFAADSLFGLNMQKFLQQGELLSGHAALVDTMKDIIVDSLGAVVAAVIGYRHSKGKIANADLNNAKDEKVFDLENYSGKAA